MNKLPLVSIVIPTFNSAGTLNMCLKSIFAQDHPPDRLEVIIADGGSTDETLKIAERYPVKILFNPLRTGEAGKSVGLMAAKGELVAFIDSDNIISDSNWLKIMVAPFNEEDVLGAEPFAFTYRRHDPLITRYVALFGVCDPLQLYVGNRNRWNWVKLNWTDDTLHEVIDEGSYYLVKLRKGVRIPTIGANGFIGRREILLKTDCNPYYFDIDVVYDLIQVGFNKVAMVKTGIVHLHANSLTIFIRKTYRRIRDYFYFRSYRKYPWGASVKGMVIFALHALTVLPLMKEAVKGYKRRPDVAWFFHPIACLLVLLTYGVAYSFLRGLGHA
jgi:glycosyltransferase involved in cell wall biosynthesis